MKPVRTPPWRVMVTCRRTASPSTPITVRKVTATGTERRALSGLAPPGSRAGLEAWPYSTGGEPHETYRPQPAPPTPTALW